MPPSEHFWKKNIVGSNQQPWDQSPNSLPTEPFQMMWIAYIKLIAWLHHYVSYYFHYKKKRDNISIIKTWDYADIY